MKIQHQDTTWSFSGNHLCSNTVQNSVNDWEMSLMVLLPSQAIGNKPTLYILETKKCQIEKKEMYKIFIILLYL